MKNLSKKDFECPVCLNLLYDPLTLNCGHTFCRTCLVKGFSYKKHCPYCRSLNQMDPSTHSPTMVISQIIQKAFPQSFHKRKIEAREESKEMTVSLGLYRSKDFLFPGQTFRFFAITPREKIMINRANNTNKRFVFCWDDSYEENDEKLAVAATIESCHNLPDGRFLVTCKGQSKGWVKAINKEFENFGLEMAEFCDDSLHEQVFSFSY